MRAAVALLAAGGLALMSGATVLALAGSASAGDEGGQDKYWVCKYAGQPEINEEAQTVIPVADPSLDEGEWFADEQVYSYVLGPVVDESDKPPLSDCPPYNPPDNGTTTPPTSEPPTSEPPTSEPPTSEPPTSEPPTMTPPTETVTGPTETVTETHKATETATAAGPTVTETAPPPAAPAAGVPTAVAAGVGGDAASPMASTVGASLVGIGLALLLAGGLLMMGRRTSGAHQV